MAGMKRFVTYIYSYEDRKKSGNTGFAKIEIRGEDCRVEVHLRGAYVGKNGCKVYLFREDAGDMVGFLLGEMRTVNGNGDFGTRLKAGNMAGSPFGMFDMDGLVLMDEEGRMFASCWKDDVTLEVGADRFREWELVQEAVQNEESAVPDKAAEISPELPSQETGTDETEWKEKTHKISPELPDQETGGHEADWKENNDFGKKTVAATEIPMRNIFPDYRWDIVWEKLAKVHAVLTPFEDGETECIQIELRELRELPRHCWYLGNNSFLLHGFFNYRYLLVGKTGEGQWFIGVPGIYQRQERVMAAIFGFPEFLGAAVSDGGTSRKKNAPYPDGEGGMVNQFGCWIRYMEE